MLVTHHWINMAEYHHCETLNVLSLVHPYSVGVAAQLHQDHLTIDCTGVGGTSDMALFIRI